MTKIRMEDIPQEQKMQLLARRERALSFRARPGDVPDLVGSLKGYVGRTIAKFGLPFLADQIGQMGAELLSVPGFLSMGSNLEMFWVAAEMGELVTNAARSIPQDSYPQEIVTSPPLHGFVWFEEPLFSLECDDFDGAAMPIPVWGYVWHLAATQAGEDKVPALAVVPLGWTVDGVMPYSSIYILSHRPLSDHMKLFEYAGDTPDGVLGADEDRRNLLAILGLLDSRVTTASEANMPRAAVRRAARADIPTGVRVIRLRRGSSASPHEGESPAEWSHRWIVSGHWRQQPIGPGRTQRRLTWIAPHIKGPDDKPLVLRPTVKALVR